MATNGIAGNSNGNKRDDDDNDNGDSSSSKYIATTPPPSPPRPSRPPPLPPPPVTTATTTTTTTTTTTIWTKTAAAATTTTTTTTTTTIWTITAATATKKQSRGPSHLVVLRDVLRAGVEQIILRVEAQEGWILERFLSVPGRSESEAGSEPRREQEHGGSVIGGLPWFLLSRESSALL